MRRSWSAFVAAAAVALGGCPTGYRYVQVSGEKPSLDDGAWDTVGCIAKDVSSATGPCAARRAPKVLVRCDGTAEERLRCRTSPGRRTTPVLADGTKLEPLITFVHLSDAQLKEQNIHIAGALDEASYDGLTNGAMRNSELEKYDDAVLLATVLSINEMNATSLASSFQPFAAPAAPSFVIHTGDAIDAGVYSELLQFIAAMDALEIPWFNVVGNHDNLFFGTFPASEMKGMDVLVPFVPVLDTDRFMRFHSIDGLSQDASLPAPVHRAPNHGPTSSGIRPDPGGRRGRGTPVVNQGSDFHGFDLACPPAGLVKPATRQTLCVEARGYYAFDAPLADGSGNLRSIVLNTAEIIPDDVGTAFDRKSKGNMYPEQLRWLAQQLAEDRPDITTEDKGKDLFVVYGHHDLRSFLHDEQAEELRKILLGSPRVVAYVTGHRHADDVVEWKREDGSSFWEVLGGSTLVYPQLGQIIDLSQDGAKNLYLRISPFRQQLGDDPRGIDPTPIHGRSAPPAISTAVAPVTEDDAEAAPQKPSVCAALEDGTSFCHRLALRASRGREGARLDRVDDDWREEATAVEKAAGVLRVGVRGVPKASKKE
ncbi:MAG: hypothetical protein HOW73_09200 [Polyangiaceae bacterium]|nr:hypothetical protein [Polyangiaceae bacterium]